MEREKQMRTLQINIESLYISNFILLSLFFFLILEIITSLNQVKKSQFTPTLFFFFFFLHLLHLGEEGPAH